ncbi:recombinase : Resolvase domain protein OS=Planctomyces brasiliensis (strain ATCC 49424 / DSM 5305 / JCM 21570 / NBRC 103401 / IFAM 1448) GN=Plabr_0993 PE=4 SV=1: Resolvase: Recombinase: Zn_ribbon_recom [Gemmata massiliana]|uniref:Recombinase domain-containing protein n=1 Tax=Gemmata massiliana TaxID=1210884 RepID=A0A6P2CZK3_9BACT|nr:recombinase family protein [Gemmata massiliana]VTR94309.1 recombinase : Resolvase domain protein OS=Planctomyces brasiliensis (strain ATCC 49424 / DSM 5305 / JCM 21570 / NBRC 103401 / IFAM 1448) GN=Plabr_0993 PE=4 SV=1: Resolvase: Recombinase: Zn_ribbon_recom [Gemmata massiliana]
MTTPSAPHGSRGVAYLRISGDKQDTATQKANIQRWLARHGLQVECWYEDVGSRDLAYKRREFQLMMSRVATGCLDWIIVDSMDRFGVRDHYEFGKFACDLRDNDCELWSTTEGHLTGDDLATGVVGAVKSARSQDEQAARGKRAVEGLIEAVKNGKTPGGYPPYGYDYMCVGEDGKEKWRLRYLGHYKRVKINPDGTEQAYDGKKNFPARDQGDSLVLVPARDPKQVEAVKLIFRWFATESISYGGIAKRLGDLGYSPIYAETWYTDRVIRILRNPAALVGRTVSNKQSQGRFCEFRGGQIEAVKRKGGRAVSYRVHTQADHIYPDQWGEGLIDRDTWDTVQAKIAHKPKQCRSAKSPELWLAEFLYCSMCGRKMAGWAQPNHKADPYSYVCSSFRQFGERNKNGCRMHRVKHSEITPLVEKWLADTQQKLAEVLDAEPDLTEFEKRADRTQQDYCRLITAVWRTMKKWGVPNPEGGVWAAPSLAEAFRQHAPTHQSKERAALKALQMKYEQATESYLELPQRAREVVRAKLEVLEADIAALEERLRPMDEKLSELRTEMVAAAGRVRAAGEACRGQNQRAKAQALSRVLARIVCSFEHYQSQPKKKQTKRQKARPQGQDRSRLVSAFFEPLLGEGRELRAEGGASAQR